MTLAQFSRDDMLIYQGREEERQENINRFVETCFKLGKSAEEVYKVLTMAFPDADSEYIGFVVRKVYQ